MSRGNIISTDIHNCSVTFQLRNGSQRTYYYSMPDFGAILGGADPQDYEPSGSSSGSDEGNLALGEIAGEIAGEL